MGGNDSQDNLDDDGDEADEEDPIFDDINKPRQRRGGQLLSINNEGNSSKVFPDIQVSHLGDLVAK